MPEEAQVPAPEQTPSTPTQPAAQPAPAPVAPDVATGATSQYTDILDIIKERAPDLASRYQSGDQAVEGLLQEVRRSQELQRLAPYAQEYMRHAGQFQAWRQEQEKVAQAQKAKSAWQAPEWNPDWRNAIERDAQGNLRAKEGYPPDTVQKYLQATQHQRTFLDKLAFEGPAALRGVGLEEIVRDIVQPMLQQNLGGYAEHAQANDFVKQNRDWLFDQQGQLSQWGQIFRGAVQEAEQIGLANVQQQQIYATRVVQHAYAIHQLQGQKPAQTAAADPNQAAKDAFLKGASPRPAQNAPGTVVPPQPALSGNNHVNRMQRLLAKNALKEGMISGPLELPG